MKNSDWKLYSIPPPPRGLMIVLSAAVLSFWLFHLIYPAHGAATPYYTGRPPPSPHYPGRCWCSNHGPRGGCIKWICKPKATKAAEFHFEMTPEGGVTPPPEPPPEPPPPEAGQPVPPERLTDWSLTGVPGGIPARNWPGRCATFSPGATAAAITNAITTCGNSGGGIVELTAGTYTAASLNGVIQIRGNNVTLRGQGAHRTILTGRNVMNLGGGNTTAQNAAITAGGNRGSTQITVANTTGLSVGTMIQIARNNDPALIVARSDRNSRMMIQQNVITAINGNVLSLRNPLLYDYTTGNPLVTFRYTNTRLTGVEDLKIDHTGFTSGPENFLIAFCDSCWIKGVESAVAANSHFTVQATVNVEFRDDYVRDGPSGPNNSGIRFRGAWEFWGGANSHFRIENNVFNNTGPPLLLSQASNGGYIGYNYTFAGAEPNSVSVVLMDSHEPFNWLNLYEGNSAEAWGYSGYHGGAAGIGTALRNYFTGFNPRTRQRGEPVQLMRLGYFYSLVGNVLGSVEQNPTAYVGCSLWSAATFPRAIYRLGFPNMGNCSMSPHDNFTPPGGYPDPRVAATLIRWGNYDYFHKAVRWEQSELPQGMAAPSRVLPHSYAYVERDRPNWWPSAIPWPPIGPDVSGGNGDASGHVNKIPAQLCWESGLNNGGAFNAAACFPSN